MDIYIQFTRHGLKRFKERAFSLRILCEYLRLYPEVKLLETEEGAELILPFGKLIGVFTGVEFIVETFVLDSKDDMNFVRKSQTVGIAAIRPPRSELDKTIVSSHY